MIKVRLRSNWFAPTQKDLTMSPNWGRPSPHGTQYQAGIVTLPDELEPHLPSSAIVLSREKEE